MDKATHHGVSDHDRSLIKNTGKLFGRNIVEFFGVAPSPVRPVLYFLPIDIGLVYFCYARGISVNTIAIAFGSGFLAWTFAEYLFHRFLFHCRPKSSLMRNLVDYLHVRHHKEPLKLPSVVLPLWQMILFSLAGILLLWPIFQSFELALLAYIGFGIGYLTYESVHYLMHLAVLRVSPAPGWTTYHLFHHFTNSRVNFGISSSFWDRVFFTYCKPDHRFTIESIRS